MRQKHYLSNTSLFVQLVLTGYSNSYTGDEVSGIYIWGAQLEQGASPTSYVPTNLSAVTRAADSLSMPMGAWFGTNLGTLITQSILPNGTTGASFPGTATLGDGSVNNRHLLYLSPTNIKSGQTRTAGLIEFVSSTGTYANGAVLKQGIAFAPNNVRSVMDGTLSPLDTAVILPNITILYVGDNGIGGKANGTINKLKYYPLRVSDAQLQLLTQ